MRQAPNNRRSRGRGRKPQQSGGGRFNTFDSNGPGGRLRGNANQLYEKYLTLARDATGSGDRIVAENFFQHADHYFRVMNANGSGDDNAQRQRSGGEGPQPDVNEGKSGDQADAKSDDRPKEKAADGEASGGEDAPAKPKRAPRRRTRAKADAEESGSDEEAADTETAAAQ